MGYSAGSTGELLWRDTWRDQRDTRRDALAAALVGYLAGSTGDLLWWDTRRDPLVSYSGILNARPTGEPLGGIHWRAALGYSAGYSAGSTGELWRDTGRDPLASCSGGILDGMGYSASCSGGILGGIHW